MCVNVCQYFGFIETILRHEREEMENYKDMSDNSLFADSGRLENCKSMSFITRQAGTQAWSMNYDTPAPSRRGSGHSAGALNIFIIFSFYLSLSFKSLAGILATVKLTAHNR